MRARTVALLCGTALFAALLCGCAPNVAKLYESDFDDLDIQGRLDDVVNAAEIGEANKYVLGSVNAVKDDLLYIEPEDSRLKGINDKFIAGVDEMCEYVEAAREGDTSGMAERLQNARSLFREADRELNEYKRELEPVPEDMFNDE